MLSELDVVNSCLSTFGEIPLNELDDEHPFVPAARAIMKMQVQKIQSKQYWFNREFVDLLPDAVSGFIYVPQDAIRCAPARRDSLLPVSQRGRRLYDNDRNTYVFKKSIVCEITRRIPFGDMPPTAQEVVLQMTRREFQMTYDADPLKIQMIDLSYRDSLSSLNTEHTRSVQANFIDSPSVLAPLMRIRGYRRGRIYRR